MMPRLNVDDCASVDHLTLRKHSQKSRLDFLHCDEKIVEIVARLKSVSLDLPSRSVTRPNEISPFGRFLWPRANLFLKKIAHNFGNFFIWPNFCIFCSKFTGNLENNWKNSNFHRKTAKFGLKPVHVFAQDIFLNVKFGHFQSVLNSFDGSVS